MAFSGGDVRSHIQILGKTERLELSVFIGPWGLIGGTGKGTLASSSGIGH